MTTIATVGTLLLAISLAQGADSSTKFRWFREDLSAKERTALVERLKKESFPKIAPVLLKTLVEYRPSHGLVTVGDAPWNKDWLTPRDSVYLMASVIWQHHLTAEEHLAANAKVILSLLQKTPGKSEKHILVYDIMNYLWCPDAEAVLLALAKDEKESLDIRGASVSALLSRCDINTYMPLAAEIILAHRQGLDRCQAFDYMANKGNRLFTLTEKNKRVLLSAGFQIITELPDDDLRTGYFVARQLGFILKIPDTFAPNQRAPQYQKQGGLTEEFFIDTVKNALKWYSINKKELQGN